jgi:hypothetical protein
MRLFTKGMDYRFACPAANIEFYQSGDDAWEQQGVNCYYPQKATVTFLGVEAVNGEPYNKWRHEEKVVFINFCDGAFEEI